MGSWDLVYIACSLVIFRLRVWQMLPKVWKPSPTKRHNEVNRLRGYRIWKDIAPYGWCAFIRALQETGDKSTVKFRTLNTSLRIQLNLNKKERILSMISKLLYCPIKFHTLGLLPLPQVLSFQSRFNPLTSLEWLHVPRAWRGLVFPGVTLDDTPQCTVRHQTFGLSI